MDQRVQAAIAYMGSNLHRKLALREIAREVRLSMGHVRRLFQRETKMLPMQHLRALRMQRARELLENSTLSVKEIAAAVGTGDVSHFVRNFKRAYGSAPTAHRSQIRRDIPASQNHTG